MNFIVRSIDCVKRRYIGVANQIHGRSNTFVFVISVCLQNAMY